MHIYTAIKRAFFTSILVATSSFTWATPIIFNFTGTISEYILSNGQMTKSPAVIPKWFGKGVSGSVIMDLDAVVPSPNHSEQTYYDSSYNNNFSQWMTFIINNPDGTSYTIPPAIDPLPDAGLGSAVASLIYRDAYDDARLFLGRNHSNSLKGPAQSISLRLWGWGEDADKVLDTIDFNNVVIKPEFASQENYGEIFYIKDNGKKMAYYFTIDSLSRVTSEVPEPGSWCLIALGFAGLILKRSGKNRRHT